jgi:DNA polymerase-3 subunit alpha
MRFLLDNYTIYHLHSDISNPTAGTGADSTTKFTQYLDRAVELGMKSIAFSEHGNVFNWIKKKEETEKRGLKYIHANEVYLTEHNDKEKGLKRDNYHYMLIAKNMDGVKELNKLSSKAFNRNDGHFYYNPRITFDELFNTSDNIIMTSACLASPIWRAIKNNDKNKIQLFQDFFVKNKHRAFLEVQYHTHPEQLEFNKWLYDFSKESGVRLIAGTDTHALNKEHQEARKIYMMSKGATYGDEDSFDLTFKSFEELVDMFKNQNAIPESAYLEAIHNTNVMSEMVEEFALDSSPKYPQLYDKPIEVFKEKINEGIKKRGINELSEDKKDEYIKRVEYEFDTYEKLDAINYMLLQKDIIDWCHRNDIHQGYSRGSVAGSLIAYLLGVTDVDSLRFNLNFTRFLNPERVSLADIDVDFPPSRRQDVIDYVANIEGLHFCEIITFNTMALRGSIDNIGRALKILIPDVEQIKDLADLSYEKAEERYPQVMKYVKVLRGVIESVGSHPSGFVVSPISLDDNIGLCTTSESKYSVSQVNMKELDGQNYVKLDMLGLDNVETVNETCKLAGIERLTPDNIDFYDEEVWKSIRDNTLGVFQWEGESAFHFCNKMFSDDTIQKIKNKNGVVDYLDLFSMGNGAIRPAGASYRDDMADGVFHDNGHKSLNDFLSNTMGYLIFQEQIMEFLVKFCGFSMAESDLVRRGLAKKVGTQQYIPKIKQGFINTMVNEFGETKEKAEELIEQFLEVINDASDYGFSLNHSNPYSMLGYANGYLKHYYPLEYITTLLNVRRDKKEKVAIITEYARRNGIEIKPIRFGKSSGLYNFNKEENNIYQGTKPISHLNEKIGEELLKLANENTYNTFTELLIDIVEKTSVNSRQLNILVRLNFFEEFGKVERLLAILDNFSNGEFKYKKTYVEKTKVTRVAELVKWEMETNTEVKLSVYDQIMFEKEHLGYGQTVYEKVHKSYALITDMDLKYSPRLTLYILKNGLEVPIKVNKKYFYNDFNHDHTLNIGDIIKVVKVDKKSKKKLVNGKWTDNPNIMEDWLVAWEMSKKHIKEEA